MVWLGRGHRSSVHSSLADSSSTNRPGMSFELNPPGAGSGGRGGRSTGLNEGEEGCLCYLQLTTCELDKGSRFKTPI